MDHRRVRRHGRRYHHQTQMKKPRARRGQVQLSNAGPNHRGYGRIPSLGEFDRVDKAMTAFLALPESMPRPAKGRSAYVRRL
jgi:hypothetical protein